MSKPIHPTALFRLTVLGPLASRGEIKHGEVTHIIRQLADQTYNIPDSNRTHLSEETIARWHAMWKRGGIDALNPKIRIDKGSTQLPDAVQSKIIVSSRYSRVTQFLSTDRTADYFKITSTKWHQLGLGL